MKKYTLFGFVFLLSTTVLTAQKTIFQQALSPRNANYQISVSLDPVKKSLWGTETLIWTNTSNDNISELQFHLYLNAFKDDKSTFMKESGGGKLRNDKMQKDSTINWGNMYITAMKVRNGENLFHKIQFIQPDNLNTHDKTVIRIPLDKPLRPHESITIDLAFKAKLPKVFARTGFAGDYYLIGQWFPKIGVYEPAGMRYATVGQWNCHQFHAHSEFYADFGNYDVKMNVPKNFEVAATGVFQHVQNNKDNTKTIWYHAEDVHDFAWTASPKFKVFEKQWRHVKLKAMMQPEHANQVERYFSSVITALEYFDKYVGKYPHPVLTMVDPPLNAQGSGGMEYPTFITCGTSWGLPDGLRFPEIVTIHEFGHQYFQGMLASNEFEESWLDEGFNQYFEGRIMDTAYGKGSQVNFMGIKMGDTESNRNSYVSMSNPRISESFRKSWEYPEGTYEVLTYTKTATWLKTLENMIGQKVMDEIMRTYFQRWKFKHPCAKDFIAIVNEIVPKRLGNKFGADMNWYFEQVLYKAPVCDFNITKLKNSGRKEKPAGEFTVEQLGDMTIPTEILVVFEDGKKQLLKWDGSKKSETFKYDKKIASVKIDPDNKILLDLNFNNNSLAARPSSTPFIKYAMNFMFWVQNFMIWMAGMA